MAWYANGRLIMNAGVSGSFSWDGSTTNYALYAALVNSSLYTPDLYNDVHLATAIANSAEPAKATGYLRLPVQLGPIYTAQKTNPTTNYVIYTANPLDPLSWTVNAEETLTAGWLVYFWDLNVKNTKVSPLTAYHPADISGGYDSTSPLIAVVPITDSVSGLSTWTTTTNPLTIVYAYDTSFTGYSTILYSELEALGD